MTNERIEGLLKDYYQVLQQADALKILSVELLPKKFHEPIASKIKESFFEFADSELASSSENTSVEKRFFDGAYKTIYSIYHDLTVITMILVSKFEIGDVNYGKIDEFFSFSVQLLLSEAHRLHLSFQGHEHSNADDDDDDGDTQFLTESERKLTQDYALITTSLQESNHEAVSILANKNTALFSSLLRRSALDGRDLGLSAPFVKTVVTPQLEESESTANVLGNLSPAMPLQSKVVTEQISSDFFHPNWYALQASIWLKNSTKSGNLSFLPAYDSGASVISSKLKGLVWLQQVGFKHAAEVEKSIITDKEEPVIAAKEHEKLKEEQEQEKEEAVDIKEQEIISDSAVQPQAPKEVMSEVSEVHGGQQDEKSTEDKESEGAATAENGDTTKSEITEDVISDKREDDRKAKELHLKNILSYRPEVDEAEVYESLLKDLPSSARSVQSKINNLLMRLNKISKAPARNYTSEKKLYFQLEKLLNYVVLKTDISPEKLGLPLSTKIPVSQNNYSGVLPGAPIGNLASGSTQQGVVNNKANANGHKSNRLSSINKKYRR